MKLQKGFTEPFERRSGSGMFLLRAITLAVSEEVIFPGYSKMSTCKLSFANPACGGSRNPEE